MPKNAQEGRSADQRPAFACGLPFAVAQEMGARLGQCKVLFRPVQALKVHLMKLDFWQVTDDRGRKGHRR